MKPCHENTGEILGCTLPADSELVAEGWQRRFLADSRMVQEAVETYGELGYEVRLEPFNEDGLKEECSGCKALLRQFSVVYTRKKNTKNE